MLSERESGSETDAEERFKALVRRVSGVDTGAPRPRAGVSDDGRYAYRYDDEGRFYAVPMSHVIGRPVELELG